MTANRPVRPRSVERALAYPYDVPERSYVIHAGEVSDVGCDGCLGDLSDRTPVLAVGSNQSPSALAWKFSLPEDGPVPVVRVRLKDFDSVYCAHFAGYGSVPATLHQAPGTTVTLFVNWLNAAQLARMHETEIRRGNYVYGHLDGVEMETEFGPKLTRIGMYLATFGALTLDGSPVALAEVKAEGRRHPALGQRDLLARLVARIAPDVSIEDFVQRNMDDEAERLRRRESLLASALTWADPRFTPARP